MTKPKLPITGDEMYSRRPLNAKSAAKEIKKVSFQHDAVIDVMLRRPRIMHKELAEMFGYNVQWISRVISSDAFQARIAQRKADLVDPGIARRLNARLQGVTIQAIDVLSRKLDASDNAQLALDALGISGKALGMEPEIGHSNNKLAPMPNNRRTKEARAVESSGVRRVGDEAVRSRSGKAK